MTEGKKTAGRWGGIFGGRPRLGPWGKGGPRDPDSFPGPPRWGPNWGWAFQFRGGHSHQRGGLEGDPWVWGHLPGLGILGTPGYLGPPQGISLLGARLAKGPGPGVFPRGTPRVWGLAGGPFGGKGGGPFPTGGFGERIWETPGVPEGAGPTFPAVGAAGTRAIFRVPGPGGGL